jgi:hypothetical protein
MPRRRPLPVVLAAALIALLVLSSCGEDDDGDQDTDPVSPAPTEVNITGLWIISLQGGGTQRNCSADLVGVSYQFCSSYSLSLTQSDSGSLSGTITASCYSGTGTVGGGVAGDRVSGAFYFFSANGSQVSTRFACSATPMRLTLDFTRFDIDAPHPTQPGQRLRGSCDLEARYLGVRQ